MYSWQSNIAFWPTSWFTFKPGDLPRHWDALPSIALPLPPWPMAEAMCLAANAGGGMDRGSWIHHGGDDPSWPIRVCHGECEVHWHITTAVNLGLQHPADVLGSCRLFTTKMWMWYDFDQPWRTTGMLINLGYQLVSIRVTKDYSSWLFQKPLKYNTY